MWQRGLQQGAEWEGPRIPLPLGEAPAAAENMRGGKPESKEPWGQCIHFTDRETEAQIQQQSRPCNPALGTLVQDSPFAVTLPSTPALPLAPEKADLALATLPQGPGPLANQKGSQHGPTAWPLPRRPAQPSPQHSS